MDNTIIIFDQIVPLETTYLNLVFVDRIDIEELKKIRLLTKLTHMNASSHLLHDEHLEIIGSVNQLEMLDLVMTEITDQGLGKISTLQRLVELRLKDNPQLTDVCIPYLANLKSLKSIHLGNTNMTFVGLKKLLSTLTLETIILDSEFQEFLEPLLVLSRDYPKLEILLKGTGTISKGHLDR